MSVTEPDYTLGDQNVNPWINTVGNFLSGIFKLDENYGQGGLNTGASAQGQGSDYFDLGGNYINPNWLSQWEAQQNWTNQDYSSFTPNTVTDVNQMYSDYADTGMYFPDAEYSTVSATDPFGVAYGPEDYLPETYAGYEDFVNIFGGEDKSPEVVSGPTLEDLIASLGIGGSGGGGGGLSATQQSMYDELRASEDKKLSMINEYLNELQVDQDLYFKGREAEVAKRYSDAIDTTNERFGNFINDQQRRSQAVYDRAASMGIDVSNASTPEESMLRSQQMASIDLQNVIGGIAADALSFASNETDKAVGAGLLQAALTHETAMAGINMAESQARISAAQAAAAQARADEQMRKAIYGIASGLQAGAELMGREGLSDEVAFNFAVAQVYSGQDFTSGLFNTIMTPDAPPESLVFDPWTGEYTTAQQQEIFAQWAMNQPDPVIPEIPDWTEGIILPDTDGQGNVMDNQQMTTIKWFLENPQAAAQMLQAGQLPPVNQIYPQIVNAYAASQIPQSGGFFPASTAG